MIWIVWFVVSTTLVNDVKVVWTNNAKTAGKDKELDDLVSTLGELALHETRIKGTRDAILEIERQAKNVNGRNVMW